MTGAETALYVAAGLAATEATGITNLSGGSGPLPSAPEVNLGDTNVSVPTGGSQGPDLSGLTDALRQATAQRDAGDGGSNEALAAALAASQNKPNVQARIDHALKLREYKNKLDDAKEKVEKTKDSTFTDPMDYLNIPNVGDDDSNSEPSQGPKDGREKGFNRTIQESSEFLRGGQEAADNFMSFIDTGAAGFDMALTGEAKDPRTGETVKRPNLIPDGPLLGGSDSSGGSNSSGSSSRSPSSRSTTMADKFAANNKRWADAGKSLLGL